MHLFPPDSTRPGHHQLFFIPVLFSGSGSRPKCISFCFCVFLVCFNQERFNYLSLSFMALTCLKNAGLLFYKPSLFGFASCFLLIRIRVCILGKNTKILLYHKIQQFEFRYLIQKVFSLLNTYISSPEEVYIFIDELVHYLTGLEESVFSRSSLIKRPFNTVRMNV